MANFHILANLKFWQCYFWRFLSPSMVSWSPSFVGFTWLPSIVIAKAMLHLSFSLAVFAFHAADQVTLIVECFPGFKFPFHAVWENSPSQFHFTMEESACFALWEVEESTCFANTLSFCCGGVSSFGVVNW